MEKLEGYIERIVFRNDDNGYTVFALSFEGSEEELTCVGSFPFISEGEYVTLSGNYTSHAVYGRQFQVDEMIPASPKTTEAMERYLGSGTIKGVGPALAKRIVKYFGADTFDIIDTQPERLAEIRGISENGAREIYKQFEEKREVRDTMLYLQQFGISTAYAVRIYNTYGKRTREILSENPYRLAEDVKGIGFKQADEIAAKMGFSDNSNFRIKAGLLYTMNQGMNSGHSFLPEEVLFRHAAETLNMSAALFRNETDKLCMDRKLVCVLSEPDENGNSVRRFFLPKFYYCELGIARQLSDLNLDFNFDDAKTEEKVRKAETDLSVELDPSQRDAVKAALKNALLIITGGPGTGKTTTIKTLIEVFKNEGLNVLLAAPTGRAAKRMSEATGMEAATIHRLLEVAPNGEMEDGGTKFGFTRNEENPLEADVIIVDEASMIDMQLMNSLLKAVTVGTRLVFSGDCRQLPSVGPGNVLSDMIESGRFTVVRLSRIFRQSEESDIIVNAHKIDRGERPVFDNKNSRDFFLLRRTDIKSVIETTVSLVKDRLPAYVSASPFDIQVLTPMRTTDLGVDNLNRVLQEALNPADGKKCEKEYQGVVFREGDKVMQVKNDYQLEWKQVNRFGISYDGGMGVFNGDMGIIKQINNFAEILTVVYDENREVEYTFGMLEELKHAYAVTVHKSQGSEYPAVVLPLLGAPKQLLYRNLLYTGVTRAAKCVAIVGKEEVVYEMIDNENENKRYTGLKEAILSISV